MNDKIKQAYDFDETADHLSLLPNSAIITGRSKKDEKVLRKIVGDIPIYFFPDDEEHTSENVGKFKGETLKELGIDTFYDDNPEVIKAIKEVNSDVKIIEVKNDIKFVTFSMGWDGLPIAFHLNLEGQDSIVGQIQSKDELNLEDDEDKEEPEDAEQRLAQYDGMIKKYPAQKVIKALKDVKDKENYFIFFDQNNLYNYAEELLASGFTKGLFPTKEDFDFEKGREAAMEFVEEHYPDIKIIPHQKVATVEEAKAIVEESEVPMVIQSEGDFVSTICPVDDVEQNKAEILSALDRYASDYAKGEILLKEKLVQPIEITPQIVFWNGEPVFTDIDIETKNIGDGENNGNQVGCGSNLIISTDFEEKINKIAFPPVVYEMAKKHTGIFVWDISLYMTEKGIFFGEFCSNRFGYDALMTEMTMAGGASNYFRSIMDGKNPLKDKFGAAIRVFNLNRSKDTEVTIGNHTNLWLYEAKYDEKYLSTGNAWDLGVITGSGSTLESSINKVYDELGKLSFKEKYTRSKADFEADFPTSIVHRFKGTNHKYFEAPDMEEKDLGEMSKKLKDIDSKFTDGFKSIKDTIDNITSAKKDGEKVKVGLRDKVRNLLNANK